jgi:hypothetical protein
MSLTFATLLPGLVLIFLGVPLLLGSSRAASALKSFPRSSAATYVFFGLGAACFLYRIWNLSAADFGDYRNLLFIGFAVIAALSFYCVPDFLAVRGLCVLVLVGAMPLLDAGYMFYDQKQIYFYKVLVYLSIVLAIWLGAQPWRLRDFFDWLFRVPGRSRALGGASLAYGLLLAVVAFTY